MLRFLHLVPLGSAFMILAACGPAPAPPSRPALAAAAPGDQVAHLTEHYWDEYQLLNPLQPPERAALRYDGGSGYDISTQFLADSRALEVRYLGALEALPRAELGVDAQSTYDIFKRHRELALQSLTFPSELLPVNPFRSLPLEFALAGSGMGPYAIAGQKDLERWRARADAYVRWSHQAVQNMRAGLRRGYTLPRVLVEETLPVLARLGADTENNPLYAPLRALPTGLGAEARAQLVSQVRAKVRDEILPAYRLLHDFLRDEYLPRARTTVGLSALPLGDAWYAFLIRRETDSTLTPADIHAQGLAEVERLRGRMQAVLAETAFAGNPQGFLDTLRADANQSFTSAEGLLNYYNELKAQTASALPLLFAEPVPVDFVIRPMDGADASSAPSLLYQRAQPQARDTALVLVNLQGMPQQPVTASAARFLRETVPGHHYQLAVQAARAAPRFERYAGDPAFVEGWGLYASSLGEELGLYHDPAAKFIALLGQIECATGLVIDTGLHAQGWSRQQALDYVAAQLPAGAAAARGIVDRDLALPGEALACTSGERRLEALRAHAQQALGARFDIRTFHAQLLNPGAMPLDLLEASMNRWIADQP